MARGSRGGGGNVAKNYRCVLGDVISQKGPFVFTGKLALTLIANYSREAYWFDFGQKKNSKGAITIQ